MDTGSRSLGGLLAEPITRHAYPQNLSDAAFHQLVDGDPRDKDPSHKPKDGDFTGPIQVGETVWVILRRESIIPAVKGVNLKDEQVRKQTYEMIYEVKLKEAMEARLPGADQGGRDREPVDRHRQAGQRGEGPRLRRRRRRQADVEPAAGQGRRCPGRGPGCELRGQSSCRRPPPCRPKRLNSSRSSTPAEARRQHSRSSTAGSSRSSTAGSTPASSN